MLGLRAMLCFVHKCDVGSERVNEVNSEYSGMKKIFYKRRKVTTKTRGIKVLKNTISPSSIKSFLKVEKNSNGMLFI